jgi:hypothetical protein
MTQLDFTKLDDLSELADFVAQYADADDTGDGKDTRMYLRAVHALREELAVAKEAAEKALTFLQELKDEGAETLCEGIHAGLRKGTDARDATALYNAISSSSTTAWSDAVEFGLEPHFSMWGGNDAIVALTKVTSPV